MDTGDNGGTAPTAGSAGLVAGPSDRSSCGSLDGGCSSQSIGGKSRRDKFHELEGALENLTAPPAIGRAEHFTQTLFGCDELWMPFWKVVVAGVFAA